MTTSDLRPEGPGGRDPRPAAAGEPVITWQDAPGSGGHRDNGQPGPDATPGNVQRGDKVRHVETGQLATIEAVWDYCDVTCVTVRYPGRSHLDNGGAIIWWARAGADGAAASGPQAAAGVTR
jgi:hypothetical protein